MNNPIEPITVCPRSSDPFNVVTYFIIWFTTSWTNSIQQGMCTASTKRHFF